MAARGTAGTRGPVPKRSSERRRRNKESAVEILPALKPGTVAQPPAKSTWHPIAKSWYASLAESGQAQFFEPSDWWYAQYLAEALTVNLRQGKKFSAMLFAAVQSGMNDLLTTEAARRRVRLEIDRSLPGDNEQSASVIAIGAYKKRLEAK